MASSAQTAANRTNAASNPVEEAFVAEINRATWRLQRCAFTEESLLDIADAREIAAIQSSVDRARTQATGVLHRNIRQLRKLQTEKWVRGETMPEGFDTSHFGIADSKQVITSVGIHMRNLPAQGQIAAINSENALLRDLNRMPDFVTSVPSAKQSQSEPSQTPQEAAA